ncbi:lanthionine synthetase C family protein [Streptomyces sp. NPDC001404]|uniref:lanthionine synthetase C family protein n=1 Tax=Streptomyces sp. NPDC001404 TaxID=3364571 RepID=UPI0036796482
MSQLLPSCEQARETAAEVAGLLADPARVAAVTAGAYETAPAALLLPGWRPSSLLLGHAGIAMLHARLAQDDPRSSATAHAHLAAAAAAAAKAGPAGAGDLTLPALLQTAVSGGYTRLLTRSAEVHASYVAAVTAQLTDRLRSDGPGLSYADYDVIAGLAGQGRVLLLNAEQGDGRSADVLADVLVWLTGLARPVRVAGHEVPGWWCAPDRYVVERDRKTFPGGDFNVGVAHGICGPLSLLALAYLAGYRVPGMQDALRTMADWVTGKERSDAEGARWPGRVSFEDETAPASGERVPRSGAGWCYGTAGIARALHLAGEALADPAVQERAHSAVREAFHSPPEPGMREDLTLCHGRSGLLHAGVRTAAATGDATLWEDVDAMAAAIAAGFDPQAAFGYRQVLPPGAGARALDAPGVLDGAAGIALALLSYADARAGRPAARSGGSVWDAALLTS